MQTSVSGGIDGTPNQRASPISTFRYPQDPLFCILESEDSSTAIYRGSIVHGSSRALQRYLLQNPNLRHLGIQSGGGRQREAELMASTIQEANLDTFVYRECCSSASFLYCSGKRRVLHANAKISFHGIKGGEGPNFRPTSAEEHICKLTAFGVSPEFSRTVYETPNSSTWEPTRDELHDGNVVHSFNETPFDENQLFAVKLAQSADQLEHLAEFLSRHDWGKAYEAAIPLANEGNAFAQFVLGHVLSNGNGIEKEPESAAKWYSKAASQDYPAALNNLGIMYRNGNGVPKDEKKAVELISKAAALGDPEAIGNEARRRERDRQVFKEPTFLSSLISRFRKN